MVNENNGLASIKDQISRKLNMKPYFANDFNHSKESLAIAQVLEGLSSEDALAALDQAKEFVERFSTVRVVP